VIVEYRVPLDVLLVILSVRVNEFELVEPVATQRWRTTTASASGWWEEIAYNWFHSIRFVPTSVG
jgi:hypothetical protein